MKYISLLIFIALAVPGCCCAQSTGGGYNAGHDSRSSIESLHPGEHGLWLGVIGGVNFNQYKTASFPYPFDEWDVDLSSIQEQNGSGRAPFFGISGELPLSRSNQSMIVCEVLYDSKNASFNDGSAKNVDLSKFFYGRKAQGDIFTKMSASLSYLIVAGGFKYNFIESPTPSGPGIQLLVYAGYSLISSLNKDVLITTGQGSNTGQQHYEATIEVPIDGAYAIRLGLRAEISYDIPLAGNFLISPLLGYDFPITKVDNTNRSWLATSIYAGIGARIGIGSSE